MYILSLEASTTSAKAMLYDVEKNTYEVKTCSYPLEVSDGETQDADRVNALVFSLGKEIAKNREILAITLGSTWHSLLYLDRHAKPVSRTYLWSYRGAMDLVYTLRNTSDFLDRYYQQTGCYVHTMYPIFKHMHLNKALNLDKDTLLSDQGSYLFHTLTNQRLCSTGTASGSGFLNTHSKTYDETLLDFSDTAEDRLGRLCTYRDAQPLTKKAAERLGLKEGIPVIPAYPDGALNQVGSGASKSGIMTVSVGTSAALRMTVHKPVLPLNKGTWCYLSPVSWLSGAATSGATNCLDWFVNKHVDGKYSYQALDQMAETLAGDAPIFLPFLFGERCPGWQDNRRGGFQNLHHSHGITHLYYAILEGIAFNIRQCYDILVQNAGSPDQIILSGGIIKSPFWAQMLADILNTPLTVSKTSHDSVMGALVLGLCSLGLLKDPTEFEVPAGMVIHPDEKTRQRFDQRYLDYLKYYNA